MTIRDWDIVTNYIERVSTSKTVTFPKAQDSVKLTNKGNTNLTYTVGTKSGTLTPNASVRVNENLSSFTVTGDGEFEVWATEAGTEKEDPVSNLPADVSEKLTSLESSLAEIAPITFDYFTPPTQPNTWANSTMQSTEYLATFYDKYIGTQSDGLKVTKTSLGKDQSGAYDIYEYVFEPENYSRTFLLSALMHGQEIVSGFSVARFIYYLMEQPDIAPIFRYIRDNVRVICLPLQNPYGFNQVPRKFSNVNSVNVNSNFDSKLSPWVKIDYSLPNDSQEWNYKGTSPFSESETKLLKDVLIKYRYEIEFWIDCHTGAGWDQDVWFYYVDSDEVYKPKLLKMADWLSQQWASKKGVTVDQLKNRILDAATSRKLHYAFGELGIPCITSEYVPMRFGGSENGSQDLYAYLMNLVNYIIAGLSTEKGGVKQQQLATNTVKLEKEIENLEYEKNMVTAPNGQKFILLTDDVGVISTKRFFYIGSEQIISISDTFARVDNVSSLSTTETGNKTWTNSNGKFGIASNKAKPMELLNTAAIATIDVGIPDFEVSADITWNTWAGVVFRFVHVDNLLQARISSSGFAVSDSVGNTYGTYAFTPVQGTTYNVKVVTVGSSIKAYLDGVERISITNTLNQSSTKVGLKTANEIISTFDNFKVKA